MCYFPIASHVINYLVKGGIVPHARAKLTLTCFGDSAPSVDGLTEFSHVWVCTTI